MQLYSRCINIDGLIIKGSHDMPLDESNLVCFGLAAGISLMKSYYSNIGIINDIILLQTYNLFHANAML